MSARYLELPSRLWRQRWSALAATNPSLPMQVSRAVAATSLLVLWLSYSIVASQCTRLWKLSGLSEWPPFSPIVSPPSVYSLCHSHHSAWWRSRCQCIPLYPSQTLKLSSRQNFLSMTWQIWLCPRSWILLHWKAFVHRCLNSNRFPSVFECSVSS